MKWILVLLVMAGGAFAYWSYMNAHPQISACARFAELCGEGQRKSCDDAFDGFAKVASKEQLEPSLKCMEEAKSCAEAAGCMAGAGAKAGVNAAGEFLKGLGESMTK